MRFPHVRIEGVCGVQPPEELTSESIEAQLEAMYSRLHLPAGRLELMTGIQSRHFWPGAKRPSEAAAEAGKAILETTKTAESEIELLMHCAVCRDRLEPATAAYVHGLLGLPERCQIFDLSNACLGFLNGVVTAASLIESGQIQTALVVSGENGRSLLERTIEALLQPGQTRRSVKPYFANLTIGAGAAAAVLRRAGDPQAPGYRIAGGAVRTDSAANELCQGDSVGLEGLDMQTDSEGLLEAGVHLAAKTWADFLADTGWTPQTPDHFVCHQVGRTHQRKLFEELGLNRAKDFTTFEYMGNVGSVSLPFTWARAVDEDAWKPGESAALLGIGSGLSAMMLGVEYVG